MVPQSASFDPQDHRFDTDVAVVGGGPGGLACAVAIQALYDTQIRVQVYENYPAFRPQGSGVLLGPNVQYALEAISPDLFAKFQQHGLPISKGSRFDEKGNMLEQAAPTARSGVRDAIAAHIEMTQKYRKTSFILGWHEIRHLLYQALPESAVVFDKQVTHYEESVEGIAIHFDRGQSPVHAKLLIGADGYFSHIRQQCLADGPPQFVGKVMWRARLEWMEGMPDWDTEGFRLYQNPGPYSANSASARLFKMGTLEETKHQAWTWVLGCCMGQVKQAGVDFDPNARGIKSVQGDASSGSALENAIKVFGHWAPALMDIVKATDPSKVTQHGLYMRPLGNSSMAAPPRTAPSGPPTPAQTPTETREQTPSPTLIKPSCRSTLGSPSSTVASRASASAAETQATEQTPDRTSHGGSSTSSQPADSAEFDAASAKPPMPEAASSTEPPVDLKPRPHARSNTEPTASSGQAEPSAAAPKSATVPQAMQDSTTDSDGSALGAERGWGKGRVTLLGDAAHATIPNGQGLALAVEDAVVLAWHLRRQGITQSALRSYERERLPRVKVIHAKGHDQASLEDKERFLYKPTFRPLWRAEADDAAETCIMDFEP